MDEFLTFINNHINHFKKYDKIEDVESVTKEGWLYIFSALCYDGDIHEILPENTDKFGKTIQMIIQRLRTYKKHVRMSNIEAIHCTFPDERERLVKAYLKYRTSIRPVAGNEYFTNCRNLIKVLMLIIVFIPDEQIVIYHKYYSEDNIEYNILFDKIDEYIKLIKENENFELQIEKDIEESKEKNFKCEFCKQSCSNVSDLKDHQNKDTTCLDIQYKIMIDNQQKKEDEKVKLICEYCNNYFTTDYNLKNHQKTTKFCLKLQNKQVEETYKCEYCNKGFSLKAHFSGHLLICKDKKAFEEKEQNDKLMDRIKELEKLNNELQLKLSIKDELNKKLKEDIKELKKINKELLKKTQN